MEPRGLVLVRRKAGGGAMAPTDELLRVLDAIGDDANQIYALYRVLMGAVAASVMVTADDTADDPQSQRANAVTIVRDLINNLELGIR